MNVIESVAVAIDENGFATECSVKLYGEHNAISQEFADGSATFTNVDPALTVNIVAG